MQSQIPKHGDRMHTIYSYNHDFIVFKVKMIANINTVLVNHQTIIHKCPVKYKYVVLANHQIIIKCLKIIKCTK